MMSSGEPILLRLYHDLLARFGPQAWWPGETPWEIATGAVLTQNTNWSNVERAISSLHEAAAMEPEIVASLPVTRVAALIRSSGTHNVKAERLHSLARWWMANAPAAGARLLPLHVARESLLGVHGIGPETADSILLYSFGYPTFVVDAYTRRFLVRHNLATSGASYDDIQARFQAQLPAEATLYNEYHALIVMLGKCYCRPRPLCPNCPLAWHLSQWRAGMA